MNGEPEFGDRVRKLLQEKDGREVWSPNGTFVFRFAGEKQGATLMPEWREQAHVRNLQLIGFFASGDTVCALPSGKLVIGFYDEDSEYAWWESSVTLEDILMRIEALDEGIEEDVFSNEPEA